MLPAHIGAIRTRGLLLAATAELPGLRVESRTLYQAINRGSPSLELRPGARGIGLTTDATTPTPAEYTSARRTTESAPCRRPLARFGRRLPARDDLGPSRWVGDTDSSA